MHATPPIGIRALVSTVNVCKTRATNWPPPAAIGCNDAAMVVSFRHVEDALVTLAHQGDEVRARFAFEPAAGAAPRIRKLT